MKPYIDVQAGQYIDGDAVVEEGPGAEILTSARKYVPGYSDSNIVYLDTVSGNDANDGSTELLAKLTYASAATAAGATKKIRVINDGAALSTNITKPTEMKRGVSGTISSSLTAPVDTWTQSATPSFGLTGINRVCYSPQKKLFVAVGDSGKIAYSADADTWTQAATPSFGIDNIRDVKWIEELDVFCACGGASKIATSTDGNVWINRSSGLFGSSEYNGITFESGTLYAFINGGYAVSSDSETWVSGASGLGNRQIYESCVFNGVTYLAGYDNTAATNTAGKIFTLSSGAFTEVSSTSFDDSPIRSIAASGSLIVAVGNSGKIGYSSNGTTWAQAATPSFGTDPIYSVVWVGEINRFVAVGGGAGKIAFSTDGDTWTQAVTPSFGADAVYSICWPVLTGRLVASGLSGKIARSTAFANTISSNVAGFTIQAVQYSGTITAYNCTMKQPGTTANLTLNACRVTEAGSHISSNTAGSSATLFEGNRYTTCTPAAQNAIDCKSDTIAGVWYVFNASETYYERIQDCVLVGGISASYPVAVFGGLANGTNVNAVFAGTGTDDPQFIDETDYKPKRAIEGYTQDSPLVAGSLVYVNSLGVARDLGAWSFREENVETKYRRHFAILKPSQKDAIKFQKHLLTSANPTANGTPSVVNVPEAAWEELILQYGSVNTEDKGFLRNQLELLEYMERQENLAVRLSWDGDDAINSLITVNGVQAAGSPTITVDETDIEPGGKFLWQGTRYTIMRVSGSVLLLDRDLADEIPDTTEIDLLSPAGYGEYRMILEKDPILTLNHFAQTDYKRGMVLRFARQCP